MPDVPNTQGPHLPTIVILASLLTVLAWELEAAVVTLHLFGPKQLNPAGHLVLLATTVLLTGFAYSTGKRHFADFKRMGRGVPLTRFQCCVVTVCVVGFSSLLTLIGALLFGNL